jgi:ubiquitin-like protein ATG12
VVVRFKAIGNAPIMKVRSCLAPSHRSPPPPPPDWAAQNNYFRITAFNRFHAVVVFLRKELGWKSGDALVSWMQRGRGRGLRARERERERERGGG